MENRKPELEDVVEMGAALNMDSSDDAYKLQTEDKVTKLKEHWEIVAEKISSNIKNIEQMIGEFCTLLLISLSMEQNPLKSFPGNLDWGFFFFNFWTLFKLIFFNNAWNGIYFHKLDIFIMAQFFKIWALLNKK